MWPMGLLSFSAHAVTSDVSLAETAEAAELFGSDGLIVTGTATGMEADPEEVKGNSMHVLGLFQ